MNQTEPRAAGVPYAPHVGLPRFWAAASVNMPANSSEIPPETQQTDTQPQTRTGTQIVCNYYALCTHSHARDRVRCGAPKNIHPKTEHAPNASDASNANVSSAPTLTTMTTTTLMLRYVCVRESNFTIPNNNRHHHRIVSCL